MLRIFAFFVVYAICCVGGTYAYFALSTENTNTIVGIAAVTDLDLDVERIVPISGTNAMVPQLEEALDTAISSEYNCIDDNGNVVCHVYKVTVTNASTSNVRLNGTMSFTGITNLPNLKWKRITSATTIGEYSSHIASTFDISFETDRLFEPNESETYYFVVWIDEIDEIQPDSGTFVATVKFDSSDSGVTSTIKTPFIEEVMKVNAVLDSSIDFSKTSAESNTNGIYLRSGTENNTNPIYYYRGSVDNNLIFADNCWKIVRTTETGGLKLIYNGTPTDGQCNNTGEASQIGTNAFNTSYNSPTYVGYMYGTPYTYSTKTMSSVTDTYYYGNDVTYSNGTYTLVDTITNSSWSSIYEGGLNNNHYTCFSTGTTCSSVIYIYFTDETTAYYITLTGGKKVEDALSEMLNYNTTSSTIKGNNTTEGTLDYWYYNNIEQKGYSNYIEDSVWCNDRTIYQKNGWDPDGGSTLDYLRFGSHGRANNTFNPSLTCSRTIDSFTVEEANGNGDLDYPVGLLTTDEIMLAGGRKNTENNSYYLDTGEYYFAGSPFFFRSYIAHEFVVKSTGLLDGAGVTNGYGVRPSISLKAGFNLTGDGDGSVTNPYVVD